MRYRHLSNQLMDVRPCRRVWYIVLAIAFVLILLSTLSLSAQSQSTYQVDLIQQNSSRVGDRTSVELIFTLKDENQRPAVNANVLSAEIQPHGGRWQATSARVESLSRPSNVVLLLDASGSMAAATNRTNVNVMAAVKEAAKSALSSTPTNAKFGVYRFSERVQAYQTSSNFSSDLSLVIQDIDSISVVPDGPTCLYDALNTSIQTLARGAASTERRELIVFTDGRDERRLSNRPRSEWPPCSQSTITTVISQAQSNSVSIHTIGLCNERCDNLNTAALQQLSRETSGFSVLGNQANLNSTFQQIVGGLSNYWIATTNICASGGNMNALLDVKASGLLIRPKAFSFNSSFDCLASLASPTPAPTVPPAVSFAQPTPVPKVPTDARIQSVDYLERQFQETGSGDVFEVKISVVSPDSIDSLVVNVWDEKGGTRVSGDHIYRDVEAIRVIEIPTTNLVAEREYRIILEAVDRFGDYLFKPTDRVGSEPTTVLDSREFTYLPPKPPPLAEIECSVNSPPPPDWSNDRLTLGVDISEPDRIDAYQVILTDESGVRVDNFDGEFVNGQPIQRVLPSSMWGSKEPTEFAAAIKLTEFDGNQADCIPAEFTITRPGFIERWRIRINNNRSTFFTLLGFLASVLVVWLIWRRLPKPQPPSVGVPPPISNTTVARDEAKLRLQVVKSATAELESTTASLANFPIILGRNQKMKHLEISTSGTDHFLNIGGDSKISHYHLKINEQKGKFTVEDLNSSNKTYIEARPLVPNQPKTIPERVTIRLGKQTHIELKIS